MHAYKTSELLLKQQNSTKVHEAQLLDARRQRKETDDQLQAMMNRIAFLAQEELRLDRDIEAARRRAAEALARQATRDQEIAATAKDVLAVLPASVPSKLRPHTGRSTLLASLSDGATTSTASSTAAPSSLRGSIASPNSTRSLEGGTQATSSQGSLGSSAGTLAASTSASTAGGSLCSGHPPSGPPPRAPSAARGRPPLLAGRAADKLNKLPPMIPGTGGSLRAPSPGGRPSTASRPSSASRPSTAGRSRTSSSGSPPASAASSVRRSSSDSASASAGASAAGSSDHDAGQPGYARGASVGASGSGTHSRLAGHAAAGPGGGGGGHADIPPLHQTGSSGRPSGMQQLSGGGGASLQVGAGGEVCGDLGAGTSGGWGSNGLTVIHAAHATAAAELDGEVLEELQQGSRAAGAAGGMAGLQEFATEGGGGRRVVQVKASRKGEGATVSAGGVGWGMGGRGSGAAAVIPPREAKQLQAEMAKKQQIWKVRKTFGLEPTTLSDRSAQVEEVGAGAWQ